jgi:hypothetical protein
MMDIVRYYKQQRVKFLMKKRRMIDFLGYINPNKREDLSALETWSEHFESLGVPYLIERRRADWWALWKEKRVDY